MPKGLHPQYADLLDPSMPRLIREAMKEFGTLEEPGNKNNPEIIGWAEEIGGWIGSWYKEDSIPWCGLFVGVIAQRALFPFNQKMLGAKNWTGWGEKVTQAMIGDVLIFTRKGGGHVGFYVGEDATHYHVLGGNQSDSVNIMRINKDRIHAIRRAKWKYKQPLSVKTKYRSTNTKVSTQEA